MSLPENNRYPESEKLGVHTGFLGEISMKRNHSGKVHLRVEALNYSGFDVAKGHTLTAKNGTILSDLQGNQYHTPEHLLAALLPFHGQPLAVEVKGKEAPIGDGSSLPFLLSIAEALEDITAGNGPEFATYPSQLDKSYDSPGVKFRVRGAENFSVSYRLKRESVDESFKFDLAEASALQIYLEEILPARTFIFWGDYQKALSQELLKGALPECGILLAGSPEEYADVSTNYALPYLDDYPYLNRKGRRMSLELAKHKILDLMGDLALCGFRLPQLAIEIENGGHYHNHLLIKDLIHEHNTRS